MLIIQTSVEILTTYVNQFILIKKLGLFGIRDPLLSWYNSYLVDKSQRVIINGFFSDTLTVSSGISQDPGWSPSPFLFTIFLLDGSIIVLNIMTINNSVMI